MRSSGRLTPNWTSVCAHAAHDTATLDALSVDGNSLVGRGSEQALLAAEEPYDGGWSNAAPYQCEHLYTYLPCTSVNLHRLCKNSNRIRLHTATYRYDHLDEPANCTGSNFRRNLQNFQHHTNITPHSQLLLCKSIMHHSNALSLLLDLHNKIQAHANFRSVSSLPRPTRSRVVPSSRLVCTYIYMATECELAPLTSQISNVHPATLS